MMDDMTAHKYEAKHLHPPLVADCKNKRLLQDYVFFSIRI